MLTRRIVIGACTLALAIPAAAGASEGTNAPDGTAPSTVAPRGPYGVPPAGPPSTVKARGPYGIPATPGSPSTTAASTHASGSPLRNETNGWRTAAIFETALLAALLLGWARLLPARHRAGHMAT
jgi:hypothetical protein